MTDLEKLLIQHESLEFKPYLCSKRKITIGVGRNLEDLGITEDEALYMLNNDILRCRKELTQTFDYFPYLDQVRQDILISMAFNLGITRLKGFIRMHSALRDQDFSQAAHEMLASAWSAQVGDRAKELAEMMRTGKYP